MKGLEITDEEKWIEEFNRQFDISRENNKTFAEMIRPIIERTNTYNFCAKTELTEMTFSRFRCLVKPNSKSKYLPKLNTFVAFCIGYEIDLPNAKLDLTQKAKNGIIIIYMLKGKVNESL